MSGTTLIQHVDDLIANKVVHAQLEGFGSVHVTLDDRPGIAVAVEEPETGPQPLLSVHLAGYTSEHGVNYIVCDAAFDPGVPADMLQQFDDAANQGLDVVMVYVQFLALIIHRMIKAVDERAADRTPPPPNPALRRYPLPYNAEEYDQVLAMAAAPDIQIDTPIPPTFVSPAPAEEDDALPAGLQIKVPEYVKFGSGPVQQRPIQVGDKPTGQEHNGPVLAPDKFREWAANGRVVLTIAPTLEVRLHAAPTAVAMIIELVPTGQQQGMFVLESMIRAYTDDGGFRVVTIDVGADENFLAHSSKALAHLPGDPIDNTAALYALYLPYMLHLYESANDGRVQGLMGAIPPAIDPGCRRFKVRYEREPVTRWLSTGAGTAPLTIAQAVRKP